MSMGTWGVVSGWWEWKRGGCYVDAVEEALRLALPFGLVAAVLLVSFVEVHLKQCRVDVRLVILLQRVGCDARFKKLYKLLRMVHKRRKCASRLRDLVFWRRVGVLRLDDSGLSLLAL